MFRHSGWSLLLLVLFQPCQGQHRFNIIREEIRIPMRDAVRLGAIVYRPEAPGRYPVLVYRTPYGARDYDQSAAFPKKAAKEGFVVVITDVRGRYNSEGEFVAYRHERQDGYDLIEWCAAALWSDGRVGTYGGSYPGMVQWQAMAEAPPHLMAAAPEMTPVGSHHFMYYGGAFSHPWLDWFVPYIFPDKRRRAGDTTGYQDDARAEEAWAKENRRAWYAYRPLNKIPLLEKYAPEYFEWLAHPDSSSWWDFLNVESHIRKVTSPVFLESGWYDAAYGPNGATRAFRHMRNEASGERARNNTILMLGPWNHTSLNVRKTRFGEVEFGPNAGVDYDEELLRWFCKELRGDRIPPPLPPVSIFVMGENRWRAEQEWPLARAVTREFRLRGSGSVPGKKSEGILTPVIDGSKRAESTDSYLFDPRDPVWDKSYEKSYPYDHRELEGRSDVLVYTTQPLTEDLEVTGEVVARLFVSSSGPDTDFTITLCDVLPDGTSINLHGLDAGYIRMRYRNGLDHQELLTPGKVYPVRIGGVYTSNLFRKGHRIRLTISSSIAPHYDPNPNTGREIASEIEMRTVRNSIYTGAKFPSAVWLPVIPR